jgi:predicted Zn-dependent protease
VTPRERPAEIAARALAALPAVDGAQATVVRERSLLLRLARSRPTQATDVDDLTVEITAVRDGHTTGATTNRSDPDALRDCGRRAIQAAEIAARSGQGDYPGVAGPVELAPLDGHDPETARLDAAVGGAALGAAVDVAGAHGVEAHGAWTAAETDTAIVTSEGFAGAERVTDAFMKVTCLGVAGRSGYASATAPSIARLDPGALAARAARKAAAEGEPATLPPGEYPVVLEPDAVGELLEWVGRLAFDGVAHVEGRGALSDGLGRRVASPAVNLSDSPRFASTLRRAFDAEGTPKRPLPLIQDGVAHRVVHDRSSGARAGVPSTGHAPSPGGGARMAVPTNLVLVGGGAADEAELCAGVERGVYVTRLWYTNALRPREGLITGLTRDGTFLIEDGRVTRPLTDLRLTDSVLGLLARVEALGRRPRLTTSGEFYGRRFAWGTVCPPVRFGAMRFTA